MPLITKRKDVQEDSKDRNTRMHRIYQFIYNADNTFGDGIPKCLACFYRFQMFSMLLSDEESLRKMSHFFSIRIY